MGKEISANATLSHYRIVSKIGAGGMGEVWLAEDTRLDRKVALKLLPAEFTQDADRVRRFMQEAKAASALNHPNIITVYDIGESEAGRFIVMELVAGRTLRSVIAEDNPLETLLPLGTQMAKALSAAHAAGITHRDIKPDNIMARADGYVKVLDFGLARLLPTASGEDAATLAQQTTPGMIMGTVAYMSPEQACGQSASPPSDIFALGIVLYELVTRQHPFRAETLVGYLHAITLQTPPPPSQLRPGIPAALDGLILRMLKKDVGHRPTAAEVAQALQEMERHGDSPKPRPAEGETILLPTERAGTTSADKGFWVAVLPFKYRGANADLEALAEELSEDIVTGLSRFSYLRVIARSSTLRYTSESGDVRDVGKAVGARYVMEGSLRQAGSVLRVAVQLVDAETGAHLWAETYDRPYSAEQIFSLQDDLVPRIVSTVADWYGVLPHSMSEAVRLKPSDQLSPYEAVLRSFGYYERITPEEHAAVRPGLERAVELTPGNADGWAMLSMIYGEEHRFGFNAQPDSLGRSLHAARQAVDAAHGNHFAWLALAQALFFRKEFDAFRDAAERAISLNPMDGSTLEYLGHLIAFSGDWERGCELAERARQLNPNHPAWYWAVPFLDAYRKGDYRSALTFLLKGNQQGHFFTQALIAAVHGQLGEREAADKTLREVLTLKPDFPLTAREDFGKWYLPELVEHLMDGLRKAGLKIVDEGSPAAAPPVTDATDTGAVPGSDLRPLPEDSRWPKIAKMMNLPNVEAQRERVGDGETGRGGAARLVSVRHTVGRTRERDELRAAFNAAKDGRGSLLCVAGEPGIGKTTLVEDFLAELTTENQCTIARGRCSERLAGTEAYLPLLDALENLLQSAERIATTMKQLAPTWYAQVAPLSGDSEEAARLLAGVKSASQERMKRELANFLQSVAHPRPLVLFFDDLHWADVSTVDLLSFLAGKFDVMRVLIVVTYRPSDMLLAKHPFLQIKPDLQARGLCRELLLEFLNAAEIAEYLALEFPGHRFPPEFPQLIHAKTEGSPLFMADLVRYLRDSSVIANTSGSWTLAQALPDIERELPESVRGMIERKISQLSEEDHKLLTAASVQGYEFDSAVVAQVLNLDADEIEERLEKLERVFAFVKLTSEAEFPNRTLTLKYRFVHVLYQNALYAGLRATRKANLSRDVAHALEGCYGERSASVANELALLWEAARESARAADSFLQAARNAAQVNAHREAAPLAERGLEALLKLPETPERNERELGLQLALGFSLQSVLSWAAPEAGAAFTRARKLCEQMGDDPRFFAALVGVWAYHLVRAQYETAHELCEQMLHLAEQSQDPVLLVTASMCWAKVHYYQGDFVSTQQLGERALSLDRRENHEAYLSVYNEDGGLSARREHSFCLWILGYPDRAMALAQETVMLAEQTSHAFGISAAHHTKGSVLVLFRDWQSSQKECEKVFALAEEHALGDMLKHATTSNALNLAYQEPTEEALEWAKQAIESLNAQGVMLTRTRYLARMGEAFWMAGRCAEGLAAVAEALAVVKRTGERVAEAEIWRIKGHLLLKTAGGNSQAEAESCYHRAIEIAQRQRAKSWELRAATSLTRLWRQQGKTAEARQMLAEIYGWFTEGFDTADLKDAKALLDEMISDKLQFVGHSPSIAVLPFVNISNDPDNEYFCDGLAEELLNALSKIEALRVAARTSAFSFKGKDTDIREIGRKLNVSTVLEGSVRKAGNRLRITVQLINIADGYHLWSERYDREMKDIFDVQDEITLTVVGALKMKLLGEEKAAVLKHYTDNTEAYQLYLKGRYHANRFTREGFNRAIEYLSKAIEKDPHYALAYAGIGDAYYHAATIHMPPGEAFLQVNAASAKALELDDALAEAHTLLAMFVAHYDRKPLEAESGFRRGIELAPNNVFTHQQYGLYLAMMGRFEEGVAELKRAQELDPLSLIISFLLGWTYYFARQPEKAKEEARKALEIDESFWMAHWTMALGYEQTSQYDEALAELEKAKALDDSSWIPAVFARIYGRLGRRDEAQKILDELAEKSKQHWVAPYLVAMAYVSLDRRNQAFEWLQKAFEDYDEWIDCINIDPALDHLRSDLRFQDLVRRVGLPQRVEE